MRKSNTESKPDGCTNSSRLARVFTACALAGTLCAGAAQANDADYEFPGANTAGPVLKDLNGNPSITAYNKAIALYRDKRYPQALEEMRAALRAQSFEHPAIGLAYSNLCLMYFHVKKYKNAQAACSKALQILPDYIPATLNLGRVKNRMEPPEE